jgi:hypothetical protein
MLRAMAGLPQLFDVDDLPDRAYDPNYVHVLSDKEELDLHKRMHETGGLSKSLLVPSRTRKV